MTPIEPHAASRFATGYWTAWIIECLALFLGYEVLELVTGHPENTLSNWVWTHLRIHAGEGIGQWSAGDLLTFAAYLAVFVIWLPWHFWWGKFR